MCGIFVFSMQWGLGLKPSLLLLAQLWDDDRVACSQHHYVFNSIDVISDFPVPSLNCLV
jgi:hypothetical protein